MPVALVVWGLLADCDSCEMAATAQCGFPSDADGGFCLVCSHRQLAATAI